LRVGRDLVLTIGSDPVPAMVGRARPDPSGDPGDRGHPLRDLGEGAVEASGSASSQHLGSRAV